MINREKKNKSQTAETKVKKCRVLAQTEMNKV